MEPHLSELSTEADLRSAGGLCTAGGTVCRFIFHRSGQI